MIRDVILTILLVMTGVLFVSVVRNNSRIDSLKQVVTTQTDSLGIILNILEEDTSNGK